jgi:type IV pilus biogenesis protein CpaD/CtpE
MNIRTIAWIAASVLLAGCSTAPRFEKGFGGAVRANLAAQTVDPRGAANANATTGVDGAAAGAAHTRYQRSFAQPESVASAPLLNTLGSGQ